MFALVGKVDRLPTDPRQRSLLDTQVLTYFSLYSQMQTLIHASLAKSQFQDERVTCLMRISAADVRTEAFIQFANALGFLVI